jgi:hypothetical protein
MACNLAEQVMLMPKSVLEILNAIWRLMTSTQDRSITR